MAKRQGIFAKVRLTPTQLRAVAETRFGNAKCLLESGDRKRSNGVIYLAGFVIECLLKARLLELHPNLQKPVDPAKLSKSDREVFELLYSHELDRMLGFLAEVQAKLSQITTRSKLSAWKQLLILCEEWTVYVRYSPKNAAVEDARRYLETVEEVKKWLGQL